MSSAELAGAGDAVAIVGMAGRFPKAKNIAEYWRNLCDGVEGIAFFSDQELLDAGVDPAMLRLPNYVKAHGLLDDAELFDAAFFDVNPREAELMDPQHRLFLECAREALDDAGYDPETYSGRIGLYAGASMNTYLLFNLLSNPSRLLSVSPFQTLIASDKDFLATRVSYKLNLRGPSITVQTACSTSLVAVALACQSLQNYQCDVALAGGVSVTIPLKAGYLYQEGEILSPDGHCRPFDARAKGTVGGNGVGLVVLKRLADALDDGDTIAAVIRGFALNNDGAGKVGYTAPSVDGQAEVIAEALAVAGVEPETITYVEAHGTGTPLGDPIEVAALTQVLQSPTRRNACALGSVKSNIGHLDAAAGIAGLIKTVLALKHGMIPPSLHFETPNPAADLAAGPFYVPTDLIPWTTDGTPRRAGVSSFGIGGTNAHLVLEEAPAPPPMAPTPARPWHLLLLSARTPTALEAATTALHAHLQQHPELPLADVAYTLQAGRSAYAHRRMLVCRNRADALATLATCPTDRVRTAAQEQRDRGVAFLFPGQGAQYVGMAQGLYQREPLFRETVDRCAEILKPHLGLDIRGVLYPTEKRMEDGGWKMADPPSSILHPPSSILDQTQYAQPALFVVEYALAQLWMSWGVRPQALIGHSIGEYVAACLAGVFSLEDALAVVAARGRMMQQLPAGDMISVALPEQELRQRLKAPLSLAAVNGPSLCVVAGPVAEITDLEQELVAEGVGCRLLRTSHAFHSPMMDPIVATFQAQIAKVRLREPAIPYVSNVSGTWARPAEATDPAYWARHLREPVQFNTGLRTLIDRGPAALLEVGPGRTLGTLARQQGASVADRAIVQALRHPHDEQPDAAVILTALGRLWLAGVTIDWPKVAAHQRRRVPLPTYPFERRRFWIDAALAASTNGAREPSPAPAPSQVAVPSEGVLPVPADPHTRPDLPIGSVPPRAELERAVVAIWQEMLGIEQIGIHDNFFELGGHSLMAARLIAQIREVAGVEVPLQWLFEAPTIAELVERIGPAHNGAAPAVEYVEPVRKGSAQADQQVGTAHNGSAPKVEHVELARNSPQPLVEPVAAPGRTAPRRAGEQPSAPAALLQEWEWRYDPVDISHHRHNSPRTVRLRGPLKADVLERSINEVIRRHAALRTTFKLIDGQLVQIITPAGAGELLLHLNVVDMRDPAQAYPQATWLRRWWEGSKLHLLQQRLKRARELALEDAQRTFDLERDLLLRASLLRLDDHDHILLLNSHHLMVDGWSLEVLSREILTLYEAFVRGKPSPLPELPATYADLATQERQQLQSAGIRRGAPLQQQFAYWRRQLANLPPPLDLPTDRPRPPAQSFVGKRRYPTFSPALTEALRVISRQEGVTMFMTLLAGLATLLYRYTGQDDILIGSPVSNRPAGTEAVIGRFGNVLVLRIDMSGNPSYRELLRRVRETAISAYAHPDVSPAWMAGELVAERDASRAPLFQVLFSLIQDLPPPPPPDPPSVTPIPFRVDREKTDYDLILVLTESDDQLIGFLEHSTDLFEDETISHVIEQYQGLLGAAMAYPDRRLDELPFVIDEARELPVAPKRANAPTDSAPAGLKKEPAMTERATNRGWRTFLLIWFGQMISLLGSGLTGFALAVWVYELTGSVTHLTLIAFFNTIPSVIFAPVAGALIDRWDRRRAMMLNDIGGIIFTLSFVALLSINRLEIWHIYVITAVTAIFNTFQFPAFSAATTVLVSKQDLARAGGLVQLSQGIAQLLAPVLAGLLVGLIGLTGVATIDFVTCLFAIVTLMLVRIPRPPASAASQAARSSLLGEIAYGWSYLVARPGLLFLLLFFAVINFMMASVIVLVTPLVLSFAAPAALGLVMSVAGLGILAGGLLMGIWGGPARRIYGVLGALLLSGISIFVAGLAPSAVLVGVAAFCFTAGMPILAGCSQAIWQSKVAPDVQGRVFAFRGMVAASVTPLAFLLGGPLTDYVFEPLLVPGGPLAGSIGQIIGVGAGRGIGLLFIVMGVFSILLVIAGALYPRMRHVEDELPDVIPDDAEAEEDVEQFGGVQARLEQV